MTFCYAPKTISWWGAVTMAATKLLYFLLISFTRIMSRAQNQLNLVKPSQDISRYPQM